MEALIHHYFYEVFGLRIRSSLRLPELAEKSASDFDAEIVEGEVPESLADAKKVGVRFAVAEGRLLLKVDHVARYLITEGHTIIVERCPGVADEEISLFLFGSAMAALLHQRGDLVLHGSAIALHDEAIAFVAHSGAGKSTLAAALQKDGYSILSDDLCVLRQGVGGKWEVQPGIPRLKLWLDSLEQLKILPNELPRVRNKLEKRGLPLFDSFAAEPRPITRIYLLSEGNLPEVSLWVQKGPPKFFQLLEFVYRRRFVEGMGLESIQRRKLLDLAGQVAVTEIKRPRKPFLLDELVKALKADFSP